MIYDYFRVTGAHDTVLDYADLFSVIFRNSIKDVTEVLLLCHKIRSDDILESLHKFRTRESAELKTVLELYDMESHQKRSMPQLPEIEDNGAE